jgi:hypothetical protein
MTTQAIHSKRTPRNPFSFWYRVGVRLGLIARIRLYTPLDASILRDASKVTLFRMLCRVVAYLNREQNRHALAELHALTIAALGDEAIPLVIRRYIADVCNEARKLMRENDAEGAVIVIVPVLRPLLLDPAMQATRRARAG